MNRERIEAKMTDREALAAALEDADYRMEQGNSISPPYLDQTLFALAVAARERLAQLPEKCGTCDGFRGVDARSYPGEVITPVVTCPTCHGSGKVYPAELVERIAAVLDLTSHAEQYAVAVLDALNGETE